MSCRSRRFAPEHVGEELDLRLDVGGGQHQLLFQPVRQRLLVHALPQRVEQAAIDHHRDQGEVGWGGQVHLVTLATHDGVSRHPLAIEKKIV